jgi:hypothetical protein
LDFNFLNQSFNDLDVAPNFVAKLLAVVSSHSEEGVVSASSVRGSHLYLPGVVRAGHNNVANLNWNGLHIVSTGLLEDDLNWPVNYTVVSENPLLDKSRASNYFVLISNAFSDKTTLKKRLALLKNFFSLLCLLGKLRRLILFCHMFVYTEIGLAWCLSGASRLCVSIFELADKAVRGLTRLSNL